MNKKTLIIIQALSATVGFGIMFIYGYSLKTAFMWVMLLNIPYILRRIAIKQPEIKTKKNPKPKLSMFFTLVAAISGLFAFTLAITKIDRTTMQTIMENRIFLFAFYLCIMSLLLIEITYKDEDKTEQCDT